MIVISIISLCVHVVKSFSSALPRSSQVKFGYLVNFLVDLDGKKCRGKDEEIFLSSRTDSPPP